jgi:release factor glutamine methyltransferase
MKIASNKLSDIRKFMQQQLTELYETEEIDSIFFILIAHFYGLNKKDFYAQKMELLSESQILDIYDSIKELALGRPVQYIISDTVFCDLHFYVSPAVLIPRRETQELVELIIEKFPKDSALKILDIGTGSGCIAITLKKYFPNAQLTAIDISTQALVVAERNATMNNAEIHLFKLNILDDTQWSRLENLDVIVSNPPYVLNSEKTLMHKNVLEHEPESALFVSDNDPLLYYKAIFHLASLQAKRPFIFLEINESLGDQILELAISFGFTNGKILDDMQSKPRFYISE